MAATTDSAGWFTFIAHNKSTILTKDNCAGIWACINGEGTFTYYTIVNIMFNSSFNWRGRCIKATDNTAIANTTIHVRLLAYYLKTID